MMKKRFRIYALIIAVCLLSISFIGCGGESAGYKVVLQKIDAEFDFHTDFQKAYLEDHYSVIGLYANGKAEKSIPEALGIGWSAKATGGMTEKITGYTVKLGTDKKFTKNVREYRTSETFVDVYNLMSGYTYYCAVEAETESGKTYISETSTFRTTANAPRNLYIEGVTNMRDLGGWQTESGVKVKQGLLYRCGRLNESSSSQIKVEITENGRKEMLDYLGITTEIDLRLVKNNEVGGLTDTSPLGESVNYVQCPMNYNVSNYITGNAEELVKVFEILSDIDNYPIIYHCNIGTDRTGMISFLVNGLLGVDEEYLYRDFLFSNFGNIGGSRSISNIQNNYLNYVQSFDGDKLSDKIYRCLVANGVPSENLDEIMNIML